MFVLTLTLLVGGHVLAGTQAFDKLVNRPEACALWWSFMAGFLLFLLALPKRFKDFTILGYIDFASILVAVGVIIIAAGVIATKAPGGLEAVQWSYSPPDDQPFYKYILAAMTIIFAYSFTSEFVSRIPLRYLHVLTYKFCSGPTCNDARDAHASRLYEIDLGAWNC